MTIGKSELIGKNDKRVLKVDSKLPDGYKEVRIWSIPVAVPDDDGEVFCIDELQLEKIKKTRFTLGNLFRRRA